MNNEACYTMLGLDSNAPSDEIKRAYRNLSVKFHPDTSGNPATARRFGRVVKAYKVLTSQPLGDDRAAFRPKSNPVNALGDSQDLFALGTILVSGKETSSRVQAAKLLGLSGKRSAWVFLRKGILDTDEAVVCASMKAISVLAIVQGGGEIARVYSKGSESLRKNILNIAAASEAEIFVPALRLALNEESQPYRAFAGKILEAMNASQA